MRLLLLELNELNFEYVRAYVARGELPVLGRLIERHGLTETTSEQNYEELEPWIQWVTAHTGLSLAEHGVFRLGDIAGSNLQQIWEVLEDQGLSVGAISPMNASNRCRNPAFFMPDPWTGGRVTGGHLLAKLYEAVAQAVNDNAQSRLTSRSAAWLAAGLLRYARASSLGDYGRLGTSTLRRRPWAKAMILDRLLSDLFAVEVRRTRPDFASLFLNAAAHIQHHYMFNSPAYEGQLRNPDWYLPETADPLLEIYRLYDRIVGQIAAAFPATRLMLATALHQDPHGEVTFYWRLKDHAALLRRLGISFTRVEPRMSRDFVVHCADASAATAAANRLRMICSVDGVPLFDVDNRGRDLFVMLTWPHDIPQDFAFMLDGVRFEGFADDVAFVAIKNGAHNGVGYLLDTGAERAHGRRIPLRDLPALIADACGVRWNGVDQLSATDIGRTKAASAH